jgi:nucleoside-diphosphate-sugar epimerase
MHRQILVTGATGALGPALAAELARDGAAERIGVLMRSPDGELAERFARWREVVRSLLRPEDQGSLERLFPVSGDICQDGLGLNGDGETLRRETDVVIHAAADTNFNSPAERQRAVNVDGTRRMLEWSATCPKLKRFLLVSSIYVSGSRTGRVEETAAAEPPGFVTYYQRTKWEAEQVALASGLPLGVARVSLVLGSGETGVSHRTGAVHSLIKWFARGLVPMVPGLPEATGDVIATELAAQCLSRAVTADWCGPQPPIWHIAAGKHAPRMAEIIDFVYQHFSDRPAWRRKQIPRARLVDHAEFNRFVESIDAAGHAALAHAMRSINGFLPDLLYPKIYETTRAEALWGGPLPQYDWRETLRRVIHFCCPPDK